MSYQVIADDIKTKLMTVPRVGIVHTYERQAVDPAKFIELFRYQPTGQILGWEITRRAVPEIVNGAHFRLHQFRLTGYMSLQDAKATSAIFQELCDDICELFRTAAPPAAVKWEYRNAGEPQAAPAQIESINDRVFAAVLCHCAEISLVVSERIII